MKEVKEERKDEGRVRGMKENWPFDSHFILLQDVFFVSCCLNYGLINYQLILYSSAAWCAPFCSLVRMFQGKS